MKSTFGNHLTARERQVIGFSADGLTAYEVASLLGIQERTIHFHKANIYRKLGVNSMIEAVKALGWLVVPE